MPERGDYLPLEQRVFVDGRCHCQRCTERTTQGYRMIGRCRNCGVDALVLYRSGDKAASVDCPRCGNFNTITTTRLATEDELPVDFEASRAP